MKGLFFDLLEYEELILRGREWLKECNENREEEIDELSNTHVMNTIEISYDGGFEQFVNDCRSVREVRYEIIKGGEA